MKKQLLILLSACSLLFYSCETDVDVIADWKEIPVVYGLLNPLDTTAQYLRITKAFLGDGNALVMARERDSLYFGDELDVRMERWLNGVLKETIIFSRDSSLPKDPGIFTDQPNILYKTTSGIQQGDDSEYKLILYNKQSGKTYTAVSPVAALINVDNPKKIINQKVSWVTNYTPRWFSSKYGKIYKLIVRFNWYEVHKVTGDTAYLSLDWPFADQKSQTTQGGEPIEFEIKGDDFFFFILNHIKVNGDVTRHAQTVDFMFTVGGEDFNTYLEVSQPSTSIVQDRPFFSNIKDGVGVFSSRYTYTITKLMTDQTVDSLSCGRHTRQLGFYDHNNMPPTCP